MAKIGFLGTGHIAAPMARVAARAGHEVAVSRRSQDVSRALATEGLGIAVADNQRVLDAADIIVLSLRPAVWEDVVAPLSWRADHRIVSVMAGVPLNQIAAACAPVSDLSVTIPYGHVDEGGCPLPVWPGAEPVATILGPENPVIPMPSEAALGACFNASAAMSGVLLVLEEARDWLAAEIGDAKSAEAYVHQLAASYLSALPMDGQARLTEARAGLATPMTLNNTLYQASARRGRARGPAGRVERHGPWRSQVITSGPLRPVRAFNPVICSAAAMMDASASCGSRSSLSGSVSSRSR